MLHFKLHISYVVTMVWFGILAYFWVRQEIRHAKMHFPNRWLVAAGAWSYSLYLVHSQGGRLIELLALPSFGRILDWCMVMAGALVFAYMFYLLVERPSHKLARKFKVRSPVQKTCPIDSNLQHGAAEPAFQKGTMDL
jgi:peptidoglycan/LPS O-acetylase OafA/YrhL